MPSCNRIIIDTTALAHNYRRLQAEAGSGVRLMAMVKSDGYGHSMVRTAAVLSDHGCRLFGVAELEEGVALRESGCGGEIVTFLGFEPGDIEYFYSHHLTPVVFTIEDLHRIAAANRKKGAALSVNL